MTGYNYKSMNDFNRIIQVFV